MFTPFLTPNFTFQLQNQIKARFQPNIDSHQSLQSQQTFYQYDPFQHHTLQNIPQQVNKSVQVTNNQQITDKQSFSNSCSSTNSPSNVNHEDESEEFQRKQTFFGSPFFRSDMFADHIKNQVQSYYEGSPSSNQNPEKTYAFRKNETQITTVQTYLIPQKQQQLFLIPQSEEQTNSLVNLKQNYDMILQENFKHQNEQISQTQRLFQMFEEEELHSKKGKTDQQGNNFPSTVSQHSREDSYEKHFFQESIVQEYDEKIQQISSKRSFLKQMSSKIKSVKSHSHKSNSSKFSLKQFKQNLNKPKEIPSQTKNQQIQNHQLYRAIFDLVTKKQHSPRKDPEQFQTIVQKLQLSILPHFKKLEQDYTQKLTQMNELVQGMILINLKKGKQGQKQGDSIKRNEKRVFNVNQSKIQINLNDDDLSEQKIDFGLEDPLQQIEQERESENKILKVSVPMITRTDSVQGLFVPQNLRESEIEHSHESQIDILASITSKGQPKKRIEDDTSNLTDDA